MPRKPYNAGPNEQKGKHAMSLPTTGLGEGFMPNFGVEIPVGLNMKPALTRPGAPARPGNPDKKGRKPITGRAVAKHSPPQTTNSPQFTKLPMALGTPPAPGQKSKAGIPPPPSHGVRNKAALSSVKLNSLPGAQSPSLLKAQPLPKIAAKKSAKKPEEKSLTDIELVLYGHVNTDLPEQPSRQIRVFLSSTFSDMKAERNEIWSSVYPAVRSHCLSHGLEFSFVDMRWGVLDHATDHHKTEDIVLNEVQRTIKLSAATSFISIIGHRYGSVVNENKLKCEKFETIVSTADKHNLEHRELLNQWYKPDYNNIPPVHNLQPISMLLPDYLSADAEKKAAATAEWNQISERLWNVKYAATKLAVESGQLSESELESMEKSVTTSEIEVGIINNSKAADTTFSIYRKFDGIENDTEVPSTAKFIDVEVKDGKTVVNGSNLEKINKFVAQPIGSVLTAGSRKMYSVTWNTGGIPTDVSQQSATDREFLQTLSHDLITFLSNQTEAHLDSLKNEPTEYKLPSVSSLGAPNTHDGGAKHVCTPECIMKCALANKQALIDEYKTLEMVGNVTLPSATYKEILHHLRLAELKTRVFCGRKQQLEEVRKYLKKADLASPLMVYGSGGGGKTPFAGQIGKLVHIDSWLGERAVVALRFLGSTVVCEQIHPMLRSLLIQISCAYQIPIRLQDSDSVKQLSAKLNSLLKSVSFACSKQRMPLVIILDGLEHLNKSFNTHNLTWIPMKLPPHVYLITTFNPQEHNLLSTAKARFSNFLELPPLNLEDMMEFLDLTLKVNNRALTPQQRNAVEGNLKLHPSPVYAQLLSQLALETHSSMDISPKLSTNTDDTVNTFLMVLEKRYGEKFVSYALSYITCGHSGISEIELEDVLSCSDEVLIEVYVYHAPPVPGTIRLPSHLWPMLRSEINQYLVEKSTHDYTLLSWYHRPIEMAISKRYLSDPDTVKMYHKNLLDLYAFRNGLRRTITLTRLRTPVTIEDADRQIAQYTDTGKLPVRMLFSMVHHLVAMGCVDKLKAMTVCSLDYITAIWKKVDLKYMSTLASNMVEECRSIDDTDDFELCLMVDFFNNYLSAFNARKYSDAMEIDLCIQILGAFSTNDKTPHINSLMKRAREKVVSSDRSLLVPTDQCMLFGQDELRWELSDASLISDVEDSTAMISVVNKQQTSVETVDVNESLSYSLSCKAKISSVRLSQRRTFALTDTAVYIQDYGGTTPVKATVKTDSLTKGECLNKSMAVSSSAKLFCLGGKDKIAVFEDKSTSSNSMQYKAISSLSLGGVKSTEATLFTVDEKYTVSAHTIVSGKNKPVGGIVKWDYDTKTTESRLSLPAPLLKDCLHLLPDEDKIVCASNHNEVYLVSLKEQKISKKLYSNKICWVSLSLEDYLLTLVLENGEIQVINAVETETKIFNSPHLPTSGCTCIPLSLIFIANKQGSVEIYDLNNCKLNKQVQISSEPLTKVKVFSDQLLEVHDAANEVLILNIDRMTADDATTTETTNSVGHTNIGVFSSEGDALLVERSIEEAASLYNTTDLTKVDIAASTGFTKVALCAKTSYLVGEKENALRLWDLGKGVEVIPPPTAKELCDSIVAYSVSPTEPMVMFANGGLVTHWNISNGEVGTVPYIGADVEQIRFCGNLVVISLRSGSTDSWLVHLLDRTSGDTVLSAEREEPISDIQCNESSAMFLCSGNCYLMKRGNSSAIEVKLSAPAQCFSSCGSNYVIVSGGSNISLIDGDTATTITSLSAEAKVSEIILSTGEYTLIALPLGNIQLIRWQLSAGATATLQSNKIQTTCSHLSACLVKDKQALLVYGRLLDQSRLFTFEMNNI